MSRLSWKIENARNIHISLKVSQFRQWNSACSHDYIYQHLIIGIKILTIHGIRALHGIMSLIKSSTGSNWMGNHIRSSMDGRPHVPYYLRAYGTLLLLRGCRHPVFFFLLLLRNYGTLLWPTWIKLNLMTYELNVDRFYAQLGVFFFYFRYFTWYRDEIWIKLNLMTQDFHVDRCCAHWALFSIFVISFDRGIKLGSNWNSWPMSLMLTDFTPNWVLFLFSLFHMIEG